jgi:maltose alpha-D-glucosyltransferase/alpha-amylase
MRDLWYKDAVIYCLDVETYQDDNADGIGDFPGLTDRLDHIAGLGATCIWLLPFYPTPNRDNGYDILDYYNVDPRLGTLGDFTEFVRQARERGLRVIADLVVNHTSDQHPWFRAARSDPDSPYRDYYVWADDPPEDAPEPLIYDEDEGSGSVWEYDERADAYYFHRFFKHQPDLNIANPLVREEIMRIMGFWLELGVSGFRLDAAPYLIELRGIEDEAEVSAPYEYLREFREFLSWRKGDAILLAEANVEPEQVEDYVGDGRRMHMLFNFVANQKLFLALAQESTDPLEEGLHDPPELPSTGQWAHFLRNHDELTLDKLTDSEREDVFDAFAPTEEEQIFGRGIRRRLPPMLSGGGRQTRMAYSLMLSLPGTPVLRYGQEIGMGDDLSLEGRHSVRTAMQWSDEKNGGFTKAEEGELARPVIREGEYGFHHLNVEQQRNENDSLLNWMVRMIRLRKECGEIGWGDWSVIETGEESVFAHVCRHQDRAIVAVHNLSGEERTVELDLSPLPDGHLNDLMTDTKYEPITEDEHRLRLDGYGYRWLRFRPEREEREPQRLPAPAPAELELNA